MCISCYNILYTGGSPPTENFQTKLSNSSLEVALTFSKKEDIDQAFIKLSTTIKDMIKRIIFGTIKDACVVTVTSPRNCMDRRNARKIEATRTFEELFLTLSKAHYWNFLDLRIMEAMATASMISAAQQSVENFKKTYMYYCMKLCEVLPDFVPVIPLKLGHTTIEEALDKDPKQLTIEELHKHRFFLEDKIFEIGPNTLAHYTIYCGSLKITWQVHVDHVYKAYSSINNKRCQLSLHAITHLSIPEVEDWTNLPVLWCGQTMQ